MFTAHDHKCIKCGYSTAFDYYDVKDGIDVIRRYCPNCPAEYVLKMDGTPYKPMRFGNCKAALRMKGYIL